MTKLKTHPLNRIAIKPFRMDAGDDFTRIHGIEPATAQLLRDSGITTFQSLHDADADRCSRSSNLAVRSSTKSTRGLGTSKLVLL